MHRSALQVEKLDSRACSPGTHPAACGRRALGVSRIAVYGNPRYPHRPWAPRARLTCAAVRSHCPGSSEPLSPGAAVQGNEVGQARGPGRGPGQRGPWPWTALVRGPGLSPPPWRCLQGGGGHLRPQNAVNTVVFKQRRARTRRTKEYTSGRKARLAGMPGWDPPGGLRPPGFALAFGCCRSKIECRIKEIWR